MIEILLPTKGNHGYLISALRSISSQSYRDFRVLIIDNSDEATQSEFIRSVSRSDSRFRIIRFESDSQRLGTLGEVLNFGLEHTEAEIVARQDDDDVSHPLRLTHQLDCMEKFDICGTQGVYVDENGNYLYGSNLPTRDKDIGEYMFWANPLIHTSVMFKKSVIKKIGAYDVSLRNGQDLDLWSRADLNGLKITNLDSYLVGVRVRPHGITGSTIALESRVKSEDISKKHKRTSRSRRKYQKYFIFTTLPNSKARVSERIFLALKFPVLSAQFVLSTVYREVKARQKYHVVYKNLFKVS